MVDLATTYLGLTLPNPLVVSACPLCEDVDNIRRMEDAGAAAVVLHSLFEEEFVLESRALHDHISRGTESFAESLSYLPNLDHSRMGPERYLEHIRRAKDSVGIPVIASLNGITPGGWVDCARRIEEAGADALELNVYLIPTDIEISALQIEERLVDLVRHVRSHVELPLAVKIGPHFSALGHTARRLCEAGANALVIFNRFYQPDFDLENLEVVPNLILSSPDELRQRLLWIAILWGHVTADLAATGGVHTAEDVVKCMMAGAQVAMMTSALYRHGIGHLATVWQNLIRWLEEHEYESIRQMQGSMSHRLVSDPTAFERGNYMRVLHSGL